MIIIGICGASGSGKSTLARGICAALDCSCAVVGQDCYYRDNSHLPFEQRKLINYDEPGIFNYDEMYRDIKALLRGSPITIKGYDYVEHVRADSAELLRPPRVLILEGIHMFRDKRLCREMSLKIYMCVDADICLLRRIERDITVRGRSIGDISRQYRATVKPMYEEFVSKYINDADLAVTQGGRNKNAIETICAFIRAKLAAPDPAGYTTEGAERCSWRESEG